MAIKYGWLFLLALLVIAGGAYYQFYSPSAVLRHKAAALFQGLSQTIATKDRGKIDAALQALFTDNAQIRLDIAFAGPAQPASSAEQGFNKQMFRDFIGNILYSLTDYGYTPSLKDFSLSPDHKTATIRFSSQEWGEGMSYNAGLGTNMRFTSDTACTAHAIFDQETPKLDKLACAMTLRMAPK